MILKLNHYINDSKCDNLCYGGQTKWMFVLIEDDNLSAKYNTFWHKVSADIKKNFIVSLSIIKFSENQNKISW